MQIAPETRDMRLANLAAGLLALPAAAGAETLTGRELFRRHFATCHGLSADGDGPMAAVLAIGVPNLTMLATGHGGLVPMKHALWVIDGGTELRSGGGTVIETVSDVAKIAEWLERLQK